MANPKWCTQGHALQAFVVAFLLSIQRCSSSSSNNRSILKALRVYGGQLFPEFSPFHFNYKLVLDKDTVNFPELERQLVAQVPGGGKPSVIFAPHVDDNSPAAKSARLYVGRREVPVSVGSPIHFGIHPEELLESALYDKGKLAYSLIMLEAEVPHSGEKGLPIEVEVEAGIQTWSYKFRVYHKLGETALARQLLQSASPSAVDSGTPLTAPPTIAPVAAQSPAVATVPPKDPKPGFAEVLQHLQQSSTIGIKLSNGECWRTTGPLDDAPSTRAAKVLGLWQSKQAHIVCFAMKEATDDDDDEAGTFKFIASRFGASLPSRGDFGFGDAVSVGLRPEIATDAIWPLQDGVRSLGVPLKEGTTFRVLAVRATNAAGEQTDLPVVTTRFRKEWPVDIQFSNRSVGSCHPQPGPSGHQRFVCRAYKEAPEGTAAHFLAFCEDCMTQKSGSTDPEEDGKTKQTSLLLVEEGDDSGKGASRQQVASSMLGATVKRPWAGWSSQVPEHGIMKRWVVRVGSPDVVERKLQSTEKKTAETSSDSDYEVFFVGADTVLPWESVTMDDYQKDSVQRAGRWVSQATATTGTMLCCTAMMIFMLGLPNRLLSVMPSLSVSVFALQLFIGIGSSPFAPEPLQYFCQPLLWLAPKTASATISLGLFLFVATLLVHAVVVCVYILHNGKGSAEALPHGLVFGSWELRVLGFLAFPLSSASVSIIASKLAPSSQELFFVDYVKMLPSFAILLTLAWVAMWTWRRVSTAIAEEGVFLTTMPRPAGSGKGYQYPIFCDHYCDQLRAVPEEGGSSYMFADWLSSPGWCWAPQVATIYRNEHRGGLITKASSRQWCSTHHNMPWRAQQRTGDVEDELGRDGSVVKLPSEYTLQKLGMTRAPSIVSAEGVYNEINERNALHAGGRTSVSQDSAPPLWNAGMQSECVVQHPVGVKTKFAYQCGRSVAAAVAGVRCLAWINIGVPASSLCTLEHHLQGEVPLRAQVGQLVGPISSGRLAACFEWGVFWPWNYSSDLLLKIILGAWLAMSSHPDIMGPVTMWVFNTSVLLATCAHLGAAVMFRPYAHFLDSAIAVVGRLAMLVGVAMFLYSPHTAPTVQWWPFVYLMQVLSVAMLAPLGLLLMGVIMLTCLVFRDASCRTCKDTSRKSEELLKQYAQAYDANSMIDVGKHSIDVLFQDMHPAPRLPALVRMPVDYLRLTPSPNRRGEVVQIQSPGKPWISVVPSLIFPVVGSRNATRHHVPIAAILEPPDDGRLLFTERASNGGLEWKEVLRSFLNPIDEACAKEAERIINGFEFPLDGALAERSLVIVELCPSDNTMTTLIR